MRDLRLEEIGWVSGGDDTEETGGVSFPSTDDLLATVPPIVVDRSAAVQANNDAMSNVLGGAAAGAVTGGLSGAAGGPAGAAGGAALGALAGGFAGAVKYTVGSIIKGAQQ